MKKFFKYITVFTFIIIVIDISFGVCMDYIYKKTLNGITGKRNYIVNHTNEKILLFGSSRMNHHYNPQIFEDSLCMTCYNCGEDGNGIIYSFGLLQLILERYTPNFIIYDISDFDLYSDDNNKYISFLKPYCDDINIMNIIASVSPSDKYKLISNLYQYNSLFLKIIGDNLTPIPNIKGMYPLKGIMSYNPDVNTNERHNKVDDLKIYYLSKFIEKCQSNGVKLIFSISPRYSGQLFGYMYPEVRSICEEYNVPFLDYYGLDGVSNNKSFFKDQTHMNYMGADFFTKKIIRDIRQYVD